MDGGVEEFTCTNEKPFTATFSFKDVGPGAVYLSFEVEGDQPAYCEKLNVHSATDTMFREFGNGAVF